MQTSSPQAMKETAAVGGVPPSEGALIAALKRGEDKAFETLVRQHGDYLYRVALRVTRSENEAGEAVQEAFISAFRGIGGFEARSTLKTWLHRLVVNSALTRLRSIERRSEVPIDELVPGIEDVREEPEWDFVESVEVAVERDSVRAAVTQAMDRLPDRYRTLLTLRDVEGFSTHEVAQLLGETEGNVKVRLHRARAALKTLLEPLYRQEAL